MRANDIKLKGWAGSTRVARVELAPGLLSTVDIVVADSDTAIAVGSGDVPVLATPRLLALAEAAAVEAIAPHLNERETSVGTTAVLTHIRPSPVGAEVVLEAELIEVDGRRLVFKFAARHGAAAGDEDEAIVGSGTIERILVDRERFMSRARQA